MNKFKYVLVLALLSCLFQQCSNSEQVGKKINAVKKIDSLFFQLERPNLSKFKTLQHLKNIHLELTNITSDTLLITQYLKLANSYNQLNEEEPYYIVCQQLLEVSERKNDYTGIGYASYYLSDAYYNRARYDSAYFYLSKAERAANVGKLPQILGYIILNKANILSFKKDFVGAETKAIHALRIASINNDDRLEYDCCLTLGNALSGLDDFDKALNYYQKAFYKTSALTKEPQYLILKAQVYNSIAKVYQKKGKHAVAIDYLNKALAFGDFKKIDVKLYSYLQNNLAYSKFRSSDPSSLKIFQKVLHISDSIQNLPTIVAVKLNLAEYYLANNNKVKALEFILDAQKIAHKNKIFEDELKTLSLLSEIDSKNNFRYNKAYIILSDSLQNVERATRNKFARIEFETEEVVQQKNVALAEKKAISAQRWLILGVSLIFMLLLLSIYFINTAKAKSKELLLLKAQQKSNDEIYRLMLFQDQKIEEGKQIEKKRISRELHDGIMGKLTSIRLNLFILSKKTDQKTIDRCLEYVSEMQNIEKEIRVIAHDLNKNLFSDNINFISNVRTMCENIGNYSGIDFKMDVDDSIDWLSMNSNIKIQIYRVIQESLQNIVKYANAKKVQISMARVSESITVTISDDGDGFDQDKIKLGIGLKNMSERAAEVDGKINIVSRRGAGTKISLTIPI